MIICAGKSESFDFAIPIGIGLVESAINLTEILSKLRFFDSIKEFKNSNEIFKECKTSIQIAKILQSENKDKFLPSKIIFVGSAGLYHKGELFEIFESQNAANIEISLIDHKSYVPVPQEIFNDVSQETFINSSNFITKNKNSAKELFELGAYAENMEFYSVLSVAKKFEIPAYGIFIATNFCDENAHKDFIKNHTLAKDMLTHYLEIKGLI